MAGPLVDFSNKAIVSALYLLYMECYMKNKEIKQQQQQILFCVSCYLYEYSFWGDRLILLLISKQIDFKTIEVQSWIQWLFINERCSNEWPET